MAKRVSERKGFIIIGGYSRIEDWRRGQDSNLQGLSPGGFQDRFLTIRIPLLNRIEYKRLLLAISSFHVSYIVIRNLKVFSPGVVSGSLGHQIQQLTQRRKAAKTQSGNTKK